MGRDSCNFCHKKKSSKKSKHKCKEYVCCEKPKPKPVHDCCDKPYCVKICNTPFKPKFAFLVFPCTRYFGFNNAIMYNPNNEPVVYRNPNSCSHDPQS